MENSKVFKFLWRANAVFLFIAGIGLIGLLLMAFSFLILDRGYSTAPPPAVLAATDQSQGEEVFTLRHPSNYGKTFSTDFTYFELRSGTDSYGKLSSGSSSQLRNIAVYDLNTDITHWVFPDAGQEIESFKSVGKSLKVDGREERTIRTGFLLTVAKTLPDRSISRDLLVMTPDGKTLKKVLSDIPGSPDVKTYSDDRKKLISESKTHIDIYPFDVDNLTVGKPTRVSLP